MFRSMRSKMILVMLIVTGAAAVLITMIFYRRSAKMIEDNYVENLYARICQTGGALDEELEEIYFLAVQASCDEMILAKTKNYLAEGGEDRLVEIAGLLRDYSGRSGEMGSVYLVIPKNGIIVTSLDYPVYQREIPDKKADEIKKIAQTTLTPALMEDPLRQSDNILAFASPVEDDNGKVCAYIMCNLKERSLYYKYLDGLEDGKSSKAFILDGDGRIVSAKKAEYVGQIRVREQENDKGQEIMEGQDMISVQCQMDFSGYSFWMEREKSEVLADLREIRSFLAVILLAVLGSAAVIMVFITRAMYHPLKKLTETMELVGGGELEQRVEVTTQDEIGILSREFNDMLGHIQSLIRQLVQEEVLKKDAELEALQYQITPHFMYNTLNSIKYAALLKGEQQIGGLLDDFIELLQASINKKGRFITVAEELHFAENYLNLQRMRYEEEIVVDYQMPEETLGCFLPRLMLQPLVENAILHGLDLRAGRNRIIIGGKIEDGLLCLWVQDNGRGMTKEQTEQILQEKHKKDRGLSKIGVANVKERLKLYYGGAGRIVYESTEEGTKVSIYLPAYKEQDKYAL